MKILLTAMTKGWQGRKGYFTLRPVIILLFLAARIALAQSEPSVTTLPALSIGADSAVLRGVITDGEGAPEILERQIEWAKSSRTFGTGKEGVDFGVIPDGAITVNGSEFSATENRFQPATAYKYRVFARNEFGWSNTNAVNVENFTTAKRLAQISLNGALDFGNVGVGESAMQTLTISNTGNSRVTISSIVAPEGFIADFSGVIVAGASVPVPVTFIPPRPGAFGGTLLVKGDLSPATNTILVSGTASLLAPLPAATTLRALAITPSSALLRGLIDGDGGSPILERRIEWAKERGQWNTGKAGVDFGILSGVQIAVSGNEFSATESRFAPGTKYRFRVRVRNLGGWAEFQNVEYFATPQILRPIFLSGNLSFGTVLVGESATRTLAISNAGNAALNVSTISFPEGFTSSFSGSVPPSNSFDAEITFAPPAGGPFGGTLKVTSDATSGVTNYPVSGTGDAGAPVPLTIVAHPDSVTVQRRMSAEVQVATAGGEGPITFQWFFNGIVLRKATTPRLLLGRVHPRDAGNYSVSVTDGVTGLVSSNATLHVIDIRIMRAPRNQTVKVDRTAVLSVAAAGAPPLTYQWFVNGVALEGATDRKLSIPNAQAENAGAYSVHVSNATGTLITPDASLEVR